MRKIIALVRKEFSHLKRDRRNLAIIFLLPFAELVILGFASNMDVSRLGMIVVDQDRTAASRRLVGGFTATEYFALKESAVEIAAVDEAIDRNRVSLALVIPAGFERDLAAGRPVGVEVIFDGTESFTASVGIGYAKIIIARFSQGLLEQSFLRRPRDAARTPLVDARTRVWFNPELKSRAFLVPGIMAMLVMFVTILMPSLAIVREKERGTLEQLIVTPIRPIELVLGKLIPFLLIGFFDLTLLTLETWAVFGVGMKGSLALFYLLTGVFIVSTIGIGFLISTISQNQQQAMLSTIFFFILPQILLAGFIFPIDNMPPVIQAVTYALPLRYYFIIIRGIFLKGAGLAELWDEVLALCVLTIVFFGLAMLRFRKRLD